jgi:hypothetical protein
MITRRVPKDHFTNIRTSPTKGNLFEPMLEWAGTRGGWRNPELDARRRRVTVGILAGVAAMGLAFMMRYIGQGSRRNGLEEECMKTPGYSPTLI